MAENRETRETQVVTDAEGRVVETTERQTKPVRRNGGMGAGVILGVIVLAGAIAVFAYSQGSFRDAGADADRAASQAEREIGAAAESTGDALETAGDNAKQAGEDFNENAN